MMAITSWSVSHEDERTMKLVTIRRQNDENMIHRIKINHIVVVLSRGGRKEERYYHLLEAKVNV